MQIVLGTRGLQLCAYHRSIDGTTVLLRRATCHHTSRDHPYSDQPWSTQNLQSTIQVLCWPTNATQLDASASMKTKHCVHPVVNYTIPERNVRHVLVLAD